MDDVQRTAMSLDAWWQSFIASPFGRSIPDDQQVMARKVFFFGMAKMFARLKITDPDELENLLENLRLEFIATFASWAEEN